MVVYSFRGCAGSHERMHRTCTSDFSIFAHHALANLTAKRPCSAALHRSGWQPSSARHPRSHSTRLRNSKTLRKIFSASQIASVRLSDCVYTSNYRELQTTLCSWTSHLSSSSKLKLDKRGGAAESRDTTELNSLGACVV
jgi:hypothetical protein